MSLKLAQSPSARPRAWSRVFWHSSLSHIQAGRVVNLRASHVQRWPAHWPPLVVPHNAADPAQCSPPGLLDKGPMGEVQTNWSCKGWFELYNCHRCRRIWELIDIDLLPVMLLSMFLIRTITFVRGLTVRTPSTSINQWRLNPNILSLGGLELMSVVRLIIGIRVRKKYTLWLGDRWESYPELILCFKLSRSSLSWLINSELFL